MYSHVPASVQGPGLKLVGSEAGPPGAAPLTLRSGVLTWHLPDGALHRQLLASHTHLAEPAPRGRANSGKGQLGAASGGAGIAREELLAARCQQALALGHLPRALDAARALGDARLLRDVALAALQYLDLDVAAAAYEAAGDKAALAQLRPLEAIRHDDNLLAGHLVALAGGEWAQCWAEDVGRQWGNGAGEDRRAAGGKAVGQSVGATCKHVRAQGRPACHAAQPARHCLMRAVSRLPPPCRRCRPRGAAAAGQLSPEGCHRAAQAEEPVGSRPSIGGTAGARGGGRHGRAACRLAGGGRPGGRPGQGGCLGGTRESAAPPRPVWVRLAVQLVAD